MREHVRTIALVAALAVATPSSAGAWPRVLAHRGGAQETTENTVEGFVRAIAGGADGIETDLRLTRDGVVVVYHDDKVGRVEGLPEAARTRLPEELTLAELTARTLLPVGDDPGGRRVPTLERVLRQVKGGVLNLELKRGPNLPALVERVIAALRGFRELDRIELEPPDLATAERLRAALGPRLRLHVNPAYDQDVPFEVALERVLKFRPHSISVSYKKASIDLVERAHAAGVEVWVWTVDDALSAWTMALLRVDAVKTDRPALLLPIFKGELGARR